jgi:hypothetical protein
LKGLVFLVVPFLRIDSSCVRWESAPAASQSYLRVSAAGQVKVVQFAKFAQDIVEVLVILSCGLVLGVHWSNGPPSRSIVVIFLGLFLECDVAGGFGGGWLQFIVEGQLLVFGHGIITIKNVFKASVRYNIHIKLTDKWAKR